jgi:tetratricopeptide (TPR) repeat protein
LPPREREAIEAHLVGCSMCRAVVAETTAFVRTEGVEPDRLRHPSAPVVKTFTRRRIVGLAAGLAAAAAVIVGVRLARPELLFGPRADRPELTALIAALANEPSRPIEGRLAGGFKYAPPPSPTRGAGDREASPDVRIAAANIEKLAKDHNTPENLAALGVAYLALDDYDAAIASLESAVQQTPGESRFQTDLSAAYIARAQRFNRNDDWPRGLAAAERALTLNPRAVEASFNRALALEGLHQDAAASEAWTRYQRLDQSAGWSTEAGERASKARARVRPDSRN